MPNGAMGCLIVVLWLAMWTICGIQSVVCTAMAVAVLGTLLFAADLLHRRDPAIARQRARYR